MKLFLDVPQALDVDPKIETSMQTFVSGFERVIRTSSSMQRQKVVHDLALHINCDPQDLYFMTSGLGNEEDIVFPEFRAALTA